MGTEWNVCMALAQIFGDKTSGRTLRKSNAGIVIRERLQGGTGLQENTDDSAV